MELVDDVDGWMDLTCRHQNHSSEEAHLLLAQSQVHQLLAEVKHGVQKVPGPHGPQGFNAVLLPTQKSHSAVPNVEQRGEANDQHLWNANPPPSSVWERRMVWVD